MEISKGLDITEVDLFGDMRTNLLVCPLCKFEYTHMGKPFVIDGNDNRKACPDR